MPLDIRGMVPPLDSKPVCPEVAVQYNSTSRSFQLSCDLGQFATFKQGQRWADSVGKWVTAELLPKVQGTDTVNPHEFAMQINRLVVGECQRMKVDGTLTWNNDRKEWRYTGD